MIRAIEIYREFFSKKYENHLSKKRPFVTVHFFKTKTLKKIEFLVKVTRNYA